MQANLDLMQGWMKLWQEMVSETLSQEPQQEKDKLLDEFERLSDLRGRMTAAFIRSRAPGDMKRAFFATEPAGSTSPGGPSGLLPNTPVRR